MKRTNLLNLIVALFITITSLSSCAVGLYGVIYSDYDMGMTATSNSVGAKAGTSQAMSILSLVATGDAGINAAAANGGITKISHVDYNVFSILGLFTRVTTTVYGE